MSHHHHEEECEHHHHHHCECCCNHCGAHHHHEHHADVDFSHQLLELADEAWMEVLKDKIRQQVESVNGSQLEKLAKLAAESNNERWKHKLALDQNQHQFKENVGKFFGSK